MPDVTRVVIYGIVNALGDHHDYATVGEWPFLLYDRPIYSVRQPPAYRVQYRYVTGPRKGAFAPGPTHPVGVSINRLSNGRFAKGAKGTIMDVVIQHRFADGRFAPGATREVHVPIPVREQATGRYARHKPIRLASTPIPDDDAIIADVLRIVEGETGYRLYRTPSQIEGGLDRVSIGIQKISEQDFDVAKTYNYDEFKRELHRRVANEWKFRGE